VGALWYLALVPGGRGVHLRAAVAAIGLCAFALAACGGDAATDNPNIIEAGQVNIQLPDGYQLSKPGEQAAAPTSSASGEQPAGQPDGETAAAQPVAAGGAATTAAASDTIPLAQQDPTTKFFTAFGTFRSCLSNQGLSFLGLPDPSKPSSPTNDPAYIKGLQTCAAQSNILQALQELQKSQDNLTPEQIEEQNQSYLKWRDCMIDHGWKIPEPVPDSKGRLLSFGPNNSTPQIEGPAGEDIFESNDFQECATQAQQEGGASSGG
jgi:hypothetical protein